MPVSIPVKRKKKRKKKRNNLGSIVSRKRKARDMKILSSPENTVHRLGLSRQPLEREGGPRERQFNTIRSFPSPARLSRARLDGTLSRLESPLSCPSTPFPACGEHGLFLDAADGILGL
ncbi:hypothetical protein CISG_07932 [Coccidioides immitis RMSCC 3703]|uniref:Uncharacterized protein n=1 Tax=Coccidioides immitis RMSCC 3703 TaxID=454286 RepID=A0A0J8R429_COCIT|nr:hypothetical protein CISG_07932 [Coccidioides immitis RMSCC 3703]